MKKLQNIFKIDLLFIGLIIFSIFDSKILWAQYDGHGVESISPEILKKYAPPPLETIRLNKLKKMYDVSAPSNGILSHDKNTLFFTWKVTGINQVWKVDRSIGFPVQLTSGNDEVSLNEVSSNGEFLIVSKDLNGQENPGLFQLNLKTGLMEELFRKPKVQTKFGFISDDSKWLYFAANDKKPDSYSIYKMNLIDKTIYTLYDGEGPWFIADHKKNGKYILFVKYRGSKQNEYYIFNTETKGLTPIIGQNEDEEYSVQFAEKENEYLVLSNKDADFKRLYILKNGKLTAISPDMNFEIIDFEIDKSFSRIIYSINRNGYTDISILNAKTLKPINLPQFPNPNKVKIDHIIYGSSTPDGENTIFSIITAQSPRLSYSYNWKTKKLLQWVLPSSPEVDLSKFAISELMHYETRDGVKIPMFVRFPEKCNPQNPDRKKCNIIVHFHGGPESQSLPGFSVSAQTFVDDQFIFVEPNVRGSDGYGRKWIEMDNGIKREEVITDIEDAALWIKKNWKFKDGTEPKIGVIGGSYGGYSTLLAMTRFAGAYDAGVAIVGMSNLVTFLNNTAPYRRILRISEYGDPVKDKEALLKLSPTTYVDKVKGPLMIIQGANDPRVPAGEAIQIHETLVKKGLPSKLILFADEGHGSGKKDNKILEQGHMLEFLKKHLQ